MFCRKIKIALFVLAVLILSGCAVRQPLTREEQINYNKIKSNAASKDYAGFSTEQLADAVVKVLTLIDPTDAKFTHSTNRIIMTRYYTAFFIFNAVHGYDFWIVNFKEKENGIISVTLIVTGVQQSGMFAMLPSKPILSNISVDETVLSEAESKLFFKRVDFFLGKEKSWIDCDNAIQFATTHNYQTNYHTVNGAVFGHFPYLCGDNWFGIEDKKPDYFEKK